MTIYYFYTYYLSSCNFKISVIFNNLSDLNIWFCVSIVFTLLTLVIQTIYFVILQFVHTDNHNLISQSLNEKY